MLTAEQLAWLREVHPGRTTRQLHERGYAMLAAAKLAGDPTRAWPLEPAPRVGLLAELGRLGLEDAAAAKSAALVLCQDRPSVKAGAAWLRRLRLGGDATATVDGLVAALAAAADRYTAATGGCRTPTGSGPSIRSAGRWPGPPGSCGRAWHRWPQRLRPPTCSTRQRQPGEHNQDHEHGQAEHAAATPKDRPPAC